MDDIARTWIDSVRDSVHGTHRVPVRAGSGLRTCILTPGLLRAGASNIVNVRNSVWSLCCEDLV